MKKNKIKPVTEDEWQQVEKFNRDLRDEFINNSTELSPKSRDTYRSALGIWFRYLKDHHNNIKHFDVKSKVFMMYQNWLLNEGSSSADISNKRSAVSSLNNYIMLYYEDDVPTFRNFVTSVKKPPPVPVHEKDPPSKAEMDMLIAELERREEWQKIAYLKFTFETGCRRAETRQLLKNFVNTEPTIKTIKVKNEQGIEEERVSKYYVTHKIRCKGKGTAGKARVLKVSDDAMDALKKWIEVRGDDDCEYMFVTKYYGTVKQVSDNTFNQWSTRVFAPILGRRFHPHGLRYARTTIGVLEDGKSLESLQRLLGHESSETTKTYLVKDSSDDESDELFVD